MQSETQTVLVQVNTKLDTLVTGFGSVEAKICSLEERMCSVEDKVDTLEGKVDTLQGNMDVLGEEVGFIKEEMVMKDEFNRFVIRTENNFEHLRKDIRDNNRLSEHIVRLEQKMNH